MTGPTWALGKSALSDSVSGLSVHSGHSVDLLDLQLEIENIEQGISQVWSGARGNGTGVEGGRARGSGGDGSVG